MRIAHCRSALLGLVILLLGAMSAFAAPTVSSFTPTSGTIGAVVTVNGSGFTGATAVLFNGVASKYTVNSDVKITATVPTGVSTGPISVTAGGVTGRSTSNFTVTAGMTFSTTIGHPMLPLRCTVWDSTLLPR